MQETRCHNLLLNYQNHILPIPVAHLHQVAQLPFHHPDPFDRLLIAQSQVERVPLLSRDPMFDRYNIQRSWTTTS